MTAPAPSAPISTSRLAHARAPGARPPAAARARGDWGARRGAWGEGRHGRGKAPDRAEEGAEHAPQPRPVPGSAEPEAASPVKWQRRGTSLHNKPAAAPGRRAGRGEEKRGKEGGKRGKEGARAPAREPAPGRRAEGRGRRACSGPSRGEPARRSRAPALRGVGEGDARAKEGGRAGAAIPSARLPPLSGSAGGGAAQGPEAAGGESHLHSE